MKVTPIVWEKTCTKHDCSKTLFKPIGKSLKKPQTMITHATVIVLVTYRWDAASQATLDPCCRDLEDLSFHSVDTSSAMFPTKAH